MTPTPLTADKIAARPSPEAFAVAVNMEIHCSLRSRTIDKAADIDKAFEPFRATITNLTADLATERQAREAQALELDKYHLKNAELQELLCRNLNAELLQQQQSDAETIAAQVVEIARLKASLNAIIAVSAQVKIPWTHEIAADSYCHCFYECQRIARAALEEK